MRPRARVRRRCRIPQNPSVNRPRPLRFSDRSQHPVPSPVLTSEPAHSPQKPSRRCPRGSSPKTPSRIPLQTRRQLRRCAPVDASLRCLLLSQNFQPSRRCARRRADPSHPSHPPPDRHFTFRRTNTKPSPPREALRRTFRRRETVRTQSPREGLFCWFISARASVRGAPLPTPSREPGAELAIAPPRHVFRGPERSIPSVSGAFSPRTVTLWSRRSLSAAPTPIGVAVEVASQARIGSRPHRARSVGGCERFLV